ncbi:MAG: hypothetical protein CVV02_03895 [Firmicutes bacterium HGW-Firmicutes-7]|nr:MAG: hypothetical protein CVV02_03895 [Firmicutes bacterium HGW-Firmicutes-7]
MNLQQYLMEQGFIINDVMSFDNQGEIVLSTGFVKNQIFVIIDHLSIFEIQFDYKRYCQKQNEWMKQYDFVYRFVENDLETAKLFLEYTDSDVDYNDMRTFNREASVIDPSPMECLFEERFAEAYGEEAYQYFR